ncbi:MAG: hypothetical protein OXR66_03760 [Candidatus Woesearchaeota archaeon]|nr:hypothetical protein [Candidatus Woesearchaeota archaeon]
MQQLGLDEATTRLEKLLTQYKGNYRLAVTFLLRERFTASGLEYWQLASDEPLSPRHISVETCKWFLDPLHHRITEEIDFTRERKHGLFRPGFVEMCDRLNIDDAGTQYLLGMYQDGEFFGGELGIVSYERDLAIRRQFKTITSIGPEIVELRIPEYLAELKRRMRKHDLTYTILTPNEQQIKELYDRLREDGGFLPTFRGMVMPLEMQETQVYYGDTRRIARVPCFSERRSPYWVYRTPSKELLATAQLAEGFYTHMQNGGNPLTLDGKLFEHRDWPDSL